MSTTERTTLKKYSTVEEATLKVIARKPRGNWNDDIKQFVELNPGRTLPAVYAKVNDLAYTMGNIPENKKISRKGKHLLKYGGYKQQTVVRKSAPTKRASKINPLKGGDLLVSNKEIRFPYKSIRLENGEVVISI